ncbi:hypothetical protein [Litoreibacter janthinus]|nr:hypothetical protein [Litoreibacter janthinus]
MAEHFAPLCCHLDDITRRTVARITYDDGVNQGLTTVRDHLKFLTARMFLGQAFCDNPLFAGRIDALGVRRANGKLIGDVGLDLLLELVDEIQEARDTDLRSVQTTRAALSHIYATCPDTPRFGTIHELVSQCWPNSLSDVTGPQFRAFGERPYNAVISAGGQACDATAFLALSVQFGHVWDSDPLYQWGHVALQTDKPLNERRDVMRVALQGHLDRLIQTGEQHD